MPSITEYYKFRQTIPDIPANTELYGSEYRGFLIAREDSQYVLWEIKLLDNTKPPIPLRSAFTTRTLAQRAIDAFLDNEARNQVAQPATEILQ